jgi:hypothetical protein
MSDLGDDFKFLKDEKRKLRTHREPRRMTYARNQIESLGFQIIYEDESEIRFNFKGKPIHFFPYTGWHTGKTIKDGRGLQKLLQQLRASVFIVCKSE